MTDAAPPDNAPATAHAGEKYARLIERTHSVPAMPTIVVHPCDESSIRGVVDAAEAGIIDPVLVGPKHRIEDAAAAHNLDISAFEIVDTAHSHESASRSVSLFREGGGEMLMKGSLHTDELLQAVTRKDTGLRTERRISHVFAMDVASYPKPLLITDAAVNIAPDLEAKRDIIQNAIDLCVALSREDRPPKVAILSAVETVTPKIPSTIEAAALCKMADRGQITGGILDGPLALDNAISPEAARIKGIESPVAGQADILVVPDLEAGNMLAKNLTFLAGAYAAGIVLGARAPIVLTSRADSAETRLASAAVAALYAYELRSKKPIKG
jgi:phosphate acetyltransferase